MIVFIATRALLVVAANGTADDD